MICFICALCTHISETEGRTWKAAIVETLGQAPVLGQFRAPEAGATERPIKVGFAALSQLTRGRAAGRHYSAATPVPFVPGVDGVGHLDTGQRVYFAVPRALFGAIAEWSVAEAAHCAPVPDELDAAAAAAIANPGMSSWAALSERARLRSGETVLVNGATGASGKLAIRIARHLDAGRVIATGRDRTKLASVGADEILPLDADLPDAARAILAEGVDVVLDYLCGESASLLLAAAAKTQAAERELRVVQIGSITSPELVLPAATLRSRPITVLGSGLGSVPLARLLAGIGGVFAAAVSGDLHVPYRVLPIERVEASWSAPDSDARLVFAL